MAQSVNRHRQVVVHNQYPVSLVITDGEHNTLHLAPLERTAPMDEAPLEKFNLTALKQQNYIRVWSRQDVELPDSIATVAVVTGMALFFGGMAVSDYYRDWLFEYVVAAAVVVLTATVVFFLTVTQRLDIATRALGQVLSLGLILGIGVGLPGYALWLMKIDFRLADGLVILVRGLQLIFISTASLLPALLYFLFDRQQLGTLRDRFEQHIFRLDPYVQTLVDVRSKYGRQMAEVFGPEAVGGTRLLRGTRWPIMVATLAITIGWITAMLSQTFAVPASTDLAAIALFAPKQDVVTFGFLGAYFFTLNNTLRRYARGDLKPKAYSSITVRIFVVFIVSWLVGLVFTEKPAMLVAFFAGIVPETGLTLLQESLRRQKGVGKLIPSFQEKHPLTELEGVDLYDRARLEDEGVTNVEGLAHHDLIDLMIETRIPVPRLVDWIDQAILYLHADQTFMQRLRGFGIRTATDLVAADQAGLAGFLKEDERSRVVILISTLKDDEWLAYVQAWRKPQSGTDVGIQLKAPPGGAIEAAKGPLPTLAPVTQRMP